MPSADENTAADDAVERVAGHYRRFARNEADPVSPLFAEWARGVAESPELLARIVALPGMKRQANLVFASARWEGCEGEVVELAASEPSGVTIDCAVAGSLELPRSLPDVVWRAGIDLNPLDPGDPEQMRWLRTLVWPGQEYRVDRITAAAEIVAADPPLVVRGDLVDELAALAARAPADATLIVFHSAVLLYLTAERRRAFVELVRSLPAVWLANESDAALAEFTEPVPPGTDTDGRFVLRRDGRPVALTGHHGQSIAAL